MILDALDGMVIVRRASLTWLAGFEAHTVENVAAVITRADRLAPGAGVSRSARVAKIRHGGRICEVPTRPVGCTP